MILHKYRECSKWTESIFKENAVWLSKPNELNDPCECSMRQLAEDWVNAKVREMKEAQMGGAIVFAHGGPAFLNEIKQTVPAISDFHEKYKAFRQIHERHFGTILSNPDELFKKLERQLADLGIFSLSETPDHPLMWAHYAQQHRGICLGFELRDFTPSTDPARLLKVRYTDNIPQMRNEGFKQEIRVIVGENGGLRNESSIPFTDESVRAAISTKSTDWAYEREWRYVETDGDRSYPLPGPLVEITFGLKCKEEDRQRYRDLASENLEGDVRLYEIRRVKDTLSYERVYLYSQPSKRTLSGLLLSTSRAIDDTSVSDTDPQLQLMIERGQLSTALPLLEQYLQVTPASAKLWRAKGYVLGQQDLHDKALECCERAIEINPAFFAAWYQKGAALTKLERYPEAVLSYERARELVPNDGSTLYNLAIVRFHLGYKTEVFDLLAEAERYGHPRAAEIAEQIRASESD